jgi:hypothetical protein
MKRLTVYVDDSVVEALSEKAGQDGRSVSNYLDRYLKDQFGIKVVGDKLVKGNQGWEIQRSTAPSAA